MLFPLIDNREEKAESSASVSSEEDNPASLTPVRPARRLAAILHADVHGYSRRIHDDETGTLQVLTPSLELLRTFVQQHGGRAVGSRGDSLLAEFPSIVEAVQCAVEMQRELKARNEALPENKRLAFRIGSSLEEIVLRGVESVFRGWSETKKETSMQARQMFERAMELDPVYAEAYAYLGVTYWLEWFFRWNFVPQVLDRAAELEQKALALDESLPGPHVVLAFISLWKKQHEQALAEARRALALDPNNAETLIQIGQILAFSGQPQEGIKLVEKAMRLNPRYSPFTYRAYARSVGAHKLKELQGVRATPDRQALS